MRHRTVEGIGINDADYHVVLEKCPYYQVWISMIQRCYSPRSLSLYPGYVGCSVTHEWHTFSIFKSWMESQDWQNKVLDKDLRVKDNKVYGPTTCIFVSQKINSLLNTQKGKRGALPLGVTKHNDKYKVTFKKNKKTHHIGVYLTIQEAATAYNNAKADWIEQHILNETCPVTQDVLIKAAQDFRRGAR